MSNIRDTSTRPPTEPLEDKPHSRSFPKVELNEHVPKRKRESRPKYKSVEEHNEYNRQAQADFRKRRAQYIRQLESTTKQQCETIKDMEQKCRVAVEECSTLRYKNSCLERKLIEKGIHELGIESDLVPNEHTTAIPKTNSNSVFEAAAEPQNPAIQDKTILSCLDVQTQPQNSRSRRPQTHEEQLEAEYNNITSIPLDDETDAESSYGFGVYPLDYNYQSFPNNDLLLQTGVQSLLEPLGTLQQVDPRAYTLNTWEVFRTEPFGGTADMLALTGLNNGEGVGYDLGDSVMNATAPVAQTSPRSKVTGKFDA
ncbi:hypothetical protein MMC19_001248 [Ptychographa xylographoides]|nr:hypothetical protein [Ptychographa xylographoides]